MNLQELQTVAGIHLPIKIIVLNNLGYHSIRQTQTAYFPDSLVGFDESSGVHFAPLVGIASAFGIPFKKIQNLSTLRQDLAAVLSAEGPQMCEVMLDKEQPFAPKVSSRRLPDGRMVSAPLEDMAPFLSREEFRGNMLVDIIQDI